MPRFDVSVLLLVALAGCLSPAGPASPDEVGPPGDALEPEGPPPSTEPPANASTPGGSEGPRDERPWPPEWAPLEEAAARPGMEISHEGMACTLGFLVLAPAQQDVFLTTSSHCFGQESKAPVSQAGICRRNTVPIGTTVDVQGISTVLAYSSFAAMIEIDESSDAACENNDLAMLRVEPSDWADIHPALLHYGGPTRAAVVSDHPPGTRVMTVGATSLRPGPAEADRREGVLRETDASGWVHSIYTASPGVQGDSGSAVILKNGTALGLLSTVSLSPFAGSNGISDISMMLDYASDVMDTNLEVATWDQLDPGIPVGEGSCQPLCRLTSTPHPGSCTTCSSAAVRWLR